MVGSIEIQGENAFVTVDEFEYTITQDDTGYRVSPQDDTQLIIPIGVQGNPGLVTLLQFTNLMDAYLASLEICDSDNMTSGTGNSAEDAGVAIGEFYMTAENHLDAPGGLLKKRLV